MFHHTNIGRYGEALKRYADLHGYVPEDGDELGAFSYASGWFDEEVNGEEWEQHVSEAVSATAEAKKAITEWQGEIK